MQHPGTEQVLNKCLLVWSEHRAEVDPRACLEGATSNVDWHFLTGQTSTSFPHEQPPPPNQSQKMFNRIRLGWPHPLHQSCPDQQLQGSQKPAGSNPLSLEGARLDPARLTSALRVPLFLHTAECIQPDEEKSTRHDPQ